MSPSIYPDGEPFLREYWPIFAGLMANFVIWFFVFTRP